LTFRPQIALLGILVQSHVAASPPN